MQFGSATASVGTMMAVKPQKPAEPQTPPGGNIENRQPPSEPSQPLAGTGRGKIIDITA